MREPALEIVAYSQDAGVFAVVGDNGRQVFLTGHSEYDAETLGLEYERDLGRNIPIEMPKNYYPNNDINNKPPVKWRATGNLIFTNWLNYFVYQTTPYDIDEYDPDSL